MAGPITALNPTPQNTTNIIKIIGKNTIQITLKRPTGKQNLIQNIIFIASNDCFLQSKLL